MVYEKTFQAAVDEAVAQSERDNALDTTTVVPLQDLGAGHEPTSTPRVREEHGEQEHADEESGLDPHVWLDPANMVTIGTAVAEQLSAVDPDRAADYTANAEALETELTTLDGTSPPGWRAASGPSSSPRTPPSATWPSATG